MSDSENNIKTLEQKDIKEPQLIGRSNLIAEVQELFEKTQQGTPLFLLLNGRTRDRQKQDLPRGTRSRQR